jgi:hypothetical protein
MMRRSISLAAILITLALCGVVQATETQPAASAGFAEAVEQAHKAELWRSKAALQARVEVEFGGQKALDATMLFDTAVGRSRLELGDGTVAVFDGKTAWVAPADAKIEGARFHLLT